MAALDILIRRLNVKYPEDQVAKGYFEGLRLAGLGLVVWPLVKAHTTNPSGLFEDLMLKIVTECEKRVAGQPAANSR